MNDVDYKQLAKEWVTQINDHDVSVFDSTLTPNFVEHEELPGIEGTGVEVPKAFFSMLMSAFPDFQMDIEDIMVEGDKVCWRFRMTGTHEGEFMGMPPTGRKMDVQGFDMLRMEGERAAEHWGTVDELKLMQQIGVVPESPPA